MTAGGRSYAVGLLMKIFVQQKDSLIQKTKLFGKNCRASKVKKTDQLPKMLLNLKKNTMTEKTQHE